MEDCCMLLIFLAVPSCFNSFWYGVIPTSYYDFYTCLTHFFSHRYGQDTVGSLDTIKAGARAGGTYYCACGIRTKWQLRHPETPVELSVSLFDSFGLFIYSKGSSSIGYRVDWCVNHHLQWNHFVSRPVEEEEKRKRKRKDGEIMV